MTCSLPEEQRDTFPKKSDIKISISRESPYRKGMVLQSIVEVRPRTMMFRKSETDINIVGENPYISPQNYCSTTGMALATIINSGNDIRKAVIGANNVNGRHRKTEDKFLELYDGIYIRLKKDSTELSRLTNFKFKIVGLLKYHTRDGGERNEVCYAVSSHETEIKRISYDEYCIKLFDHILKAFPDCCIIGGNTTLAKSYLKEYAAFLFNEAEHNLVVNDIYEYHGWEEVKNKHIYLSSARADCECECYVPNMINIQVPDVWNEGVNILNIGKKVYFDNGKLDAHQTYRVSLPFWLYLHLGYASKLFHDAGANLQFILVIVGPSGCLKTSTCKTFASPFQSDEMIRFESTSRAIELYRESCIDQNMIVDDIFRQTDALLAKFEEILRAYGDEVGRAKSGGKNFGDLVRTKVRGGCIVTAENMLESQQSSTLRYITLRLEKDSIDSKVLAEFQENQRRAKRNKQPSLVQNYFAGWIHYLEKHYDEIVDYIERYQPTNLVFRFKRHQQIHKAFSVIAFFILRWGEEIGAISIEREKQIFGLWSEIITMLIKQNEDMAISSEPWQQFILTLQSSIGTGSFPIADTKEIYESHNGKFFGFKRCVKNEEMEYVLSPENTYTHVRTKMQEIEKQLVIKEMALYRDLCERGIAKGYVDQANGKKNRNRYLKRVMLHGHQVEMLIISVEAMEKAIEDIRRS